LILFFSALIDWRKKLRAELVKEEKSLTEEAKEQNVVEDEVISDADEVDQYMEEEARDAKKKKRKILKEKRKLNERMNLKMILKNDEIIEEELELFQLKNIRNKKLLNQIEEINLSDVEVDVEEDNENGEQTFKKSEKVFYDKDSLKSANDYDDSGNEDEDKDDGEGIGDEDIEVEQNIGNRVEESDDEDDGLVVDLEDTNEAKRNKTKMFFENDIFRDEMNDEDDDIELELIENRLNPKNKTHDKREKKQNKRQIEDQLEDNESVSSDDENELKPKNKKQKNENKRNEKCEKDVKLTPEELAIGTLMIRSQKTKRDILDNAWNRYVHEDDKFLPSWFRKDEEKYFRKPVPVTQEMVKEYKQQLREINARPIKKVTEAKARQKKKALRKLEKARKRAEHITNAPDMTNSEKAQHIKRYSLLVLI